VEIISRPGNILFPGTPWRPSCLPNQTGWHERIHHGFHHPSNSREIHMFFAFRFFSSPRPQGQFGKSQINHCGQEDSMPGQWFSKAASRV
jgi:hypothetical protein